MQELDVGVGGAHKGARLMGDSIRPRHRRTVRTVDRHVLTTEERGVPLVGIEALPLILGDLPQHPPHVALVVGLEVRRPALPFGGENAERQTEAPDASRAHDLRSRHSIPHVIGVHVRPVGEIQEHRVAS